MTTFIDQLRLAERAEEDIYFARIDRELIDALHQHGQPDCLVRPQNKRSLTQPDTSTEQIAASGAQQAADKQ